MATTLTPFGDTRIHQYDGLYSLNDLHKLSGGLGHHQPAKFTALESTKALVAELAKSPNSEIYLKAVRGAHGGTYACRELVIAYAAWISASFHLKVIRVFLDTQTPQAATPPLTPPEPQYFNFKLTVRIDGEEQYGHITPLPEGSLCTTREGFIRALEDPASFNPEFISGLTRALLKRMERHEQRMKFLKGKAQTH